MISLPKVPVGTNTTPTSLVVAEESAEAVTMHTNTAEGTPSPSSLTMQGVVEVVLLQQVPVRTHFVPTSTIPSFESSVTIQVTRNAPSSSPEPARWLVEVLALPQVPV